MGKHSPEYVKQHFDKAIENLRDTLEFCRKVESKMPSSVLEQIEKWETAAPGQA
jgi:hypothetical protein